jgi:carboxypeptidase Q
MKRFFMLNFFIILTFIYIAKGQNDSVVDRIIDIAAQDNQTMDHLDVLCNRFGGRLIGSDAYENAADWAAHKFEEWGMEVIMDEVGEMPVGFNRGPWFGKLLGEEGMHLHFATPSYTVGTKGVQRGHVLLEPKTQKDFERMKGRLKGAWVLISGENKGYPIDFSEEGNARRDSIIIENEKIAEQNREIRRENRKKQRIRWSCARGDCPH